VNWLPGGIAGIAFAVAAILLKDISKNAVPTAILGFATVIPSAIEIVLQYQYAELKYTPASFIYGIGKSAELYPRIMVIEAVGAIFLIVTVWLFAKCLRDMTAQHCVLYEKALPETRTGKGKDLAQNINRRYNVAFYLMAAMSVVSGVHGIIAVYYPEIWILNILIGIVMAIFLFRARNMAKDDLYDKLRDRI
jgi:cobalamin synthase